MPLVTCRTCRQLALRQAERSPYAMFMMFVTSLFVANLVCVHGISSHFYRRSCLAVQASCCLCFAGDKTGRSRGGSGSASGTRKPSPKRQPEKRDKSTKDSAKKTSEKEASKPRPSSDDPEASAKATSVKDASHRSGSRQPEKRSRDSSGARDRNKERSRDRSREKSSDKSREKSRDKSRERSLHRGSHPAGRSERNEVNDAKPLGQESRDRDSRGNGLSHGRSELSRPAKSLHDKVSDGKEGSRNTDKELLSKSAAQNRTSDLPDRKQVSRTELDLPSEQKDLSGPSAGKTKFTRR